MPYVTETEYSNMMKKLEDRELLLGSLKSFRTWYMTLGHLNPDSLIELKRIVPNELINQMAVALQQSEGDTSVFNSFIEKADVPQEGE